MPDFRQGKPWWSTVNDLPVGNENEMLKKKYNIPDDILGAEEMLKEESPLSILAGEVKKSMAKAAASSAGVDQKMLERFTQGMDFEIDRNASLPKTDKKTRAPRTPKVKSEGMAPSTGTKVASEIAKSAEQVSPTIPKSVDKSLLQRLASTAKGSKLPLVGAGLLGAGILYNLMTRDIEPTMPNLPDPEPLDIPNQGNKSNFYRDMLERGVKGIDEVVEETKRRQR